MRRVAVAVIGWSMASAATAGEPARVGVAEHLRGPVSEARIVPLVADVDHRLRIDDPRGRLRTGLGGTLVNLMPFEHSRFHLSAGGRLFARPRPNKALDERGLLSAPRLGSGWRPGRRFAPALLMGIDEPAGGGVSLGVDAGVIMGAAVERGMRVPRGLRRGGDARGGGAPHSPNGVARLTVDYRF